LPLDTQSMLVRNATYERLTVDAVLAGDREDRVRALSQNPLVPSVDVARSALEIIEGRVGTSEAM